MAGSDPMASRDPSHAAGSSRGGRAEAPAEVACDLCGYAMPTPTVRNPDGSIPGLFVCSACVEDELTARMETQP